MEVFGFMENENGDAIVTADKVLCEICDDWVKHSSNTANLLTHLKYYHFIEHEEIILFVRRAAAEEHSQLTSVTKIRHQPSIVEIISRKGAYKKDSSRYLTCQDALVAFICSDLQLIRVTGNPSFCQQLYTLDQDLNHILVHSLVE